MISPTQLHDAVLERARARAQVVEENKGTVRYALSHFEKHIQAVTSCLTGHRDPVDGSSHGEIAHIMTPMARCT